MENISLLYDEDCPLCRWYTSLFVKYGILDTDGRISYNKYVILHPTKINADIAQTKIACIDHQTNQVYYGIDGLVLVLGYRFKLIRILGNFKPINLLLKLLYLLFSYNRRIFAPVAKRAVECTCEPPKSILWRSIFIALLSFFTYLIVSWYFKHFLAHYMLASPPNDLILLMAQLGFQWGAFLFFHQKNSYDYLGHLVFTSFLGALLLAFFGFGIQILNLFGIQTEFLAIVCYGITILFMFLEHKRRIQLKEWTWKLTISWIVFRILIYPFVFQI
jgi:hypothetical protein